MLGDNVFIQALQELNNHQILHGECTITFTYHDGRISVLHGFNQRTAQRCFFKKVAWSDGC